MGEPDGTTGAAAADATAARIGGGYAFDGPAVELGSVVTEGAPHPSARVRVPIGMLNRHGLVAGATGTGKTKTLQLITEQLSAAGVPVFVADIKGDLSGLAAAGEPGDRITKRAADTGDDWQPTAYPVEFLAIGGIGTGVPLRATVTSFGPILLAKVLGLNETQESSLGLVFHYADKAGLPLLDLKDLRAVIQYLVSDEGKADLQQLGGLSKATAGVILRQLVALADAAEPFFGEPEFDSRDLLRTATDGRGIVSAVELAGLQDRPALFSTFLLWLLADLFEDLPEVGDPDKPKLVFFFDEAHLLFDGASKAFLDAVTRTVRLIRSKGVGVFFVTQQPTDVPDDVLAQLANRVQHALRAFTPDDADALRKTVRTYPKTGDYQLEEALTALGTGEAIVTVMSERGAPTPVAWTMLRAPRSRMAPADAAAITATVSGSPLQAEYGQAVDRDSAYERLAAKLAPPPAHAPAEGPAQAPAPEQPRRPEPEQSGLGTVVTSVLGSSATKSFLRSAATVLGREITRGMLGNAKKRRR
ncbi:MAG TPA: helicase HerA-like domain-containing protein [Mycobacteriales bacterium]|nr:helicase HerA-like domain-containing protein [Mycobacteriales bacterium]